MTRKKIIEGKRDELQRLVDEWANRNNFLTANERLVVSISLKRWRVYEKNVIIREKIVQSDWLKIKELDWTDRQMAVIDLFKKHKELSAEEVAKKLPGIGDSVSVFMLIDAINRNFRDERLPYYLKTFGLYGTYAPKRPYRIVVIKRKE